MLCRSPIPDSAVYLRVRITAAMAFGKTTLKQGSQTVEPELISAGRMPKIDIWTAGVLG